MERMPRLSSIVIQLALAWLAGCASPFDRHVAPVDPMGMYPTGNGFQDLPQSLATASMNDWNFRKLGW
jgi:hypothetical protein